MDCADDTGLVPLAQISLINPLKGGQSSKNQVLCFSTFLDMTAWFCGPISPQEFQLARDRVVVVGLGLQTGLCYQLDHLDLVDGAAN